jgi:hypothetical protein
MRASKSAYIYQALIKKHSRCLYFTLCALQLGRCYFTLSTLISSVDAKTFPTKKHNNWHCSSEREIKFSRCRTKTTSAIISSYIYLLLYIFVRETKLRSKGLRALQSISQYNLLYWRLFGLYLAVSNRAIEHSYKSRVIKSLTLLFVNLELLTLIPFLCSYVLIQVYRGIQS